jgi:hypothetical protein
MRQRRMLFLSISVGFIHATAFGSDSLLLKQVHQNHRLIPMNRPVKVISEKNMAPAPFSLTLVGTLASPRISGHVLEASDLFLSSGKAFVAYNLAGGPALGGVDVVTLHASEPPTLDLELLTENSSINAVSYDPTSKEVYMVGESGVNDKPAFLATAQLTLGLPVFPAKTYSLPSFAATHVAVGNHRVYVTSGDQGGLTIFKKDRPALTLMTYSPIFDARAIGFTSTEDQLMVASGRPATLTVLDASGNTQHAYSYSGATLPDSKSTIQVGNQTSLVSAGDAGAYLVCNETGNILASIPVVTGSGMPATDTVTNSATECGGVIFTTNGGAGVYAYRKTENKNACQGVTITKLGSLDFGEDFVSANHVSCLHNTLLVASGRGGMKIVSVNFGKVED